MIKRISNTEYEFTVPCVGFETYKKKLKEYTHDNETEFNRYYSAIKTNFPKEITFKLYSKQVEDKAVALISAKNITLHASLEREREYYESPVKGIFFIDGHYYGNALLHTVFAKRLKNYARIVINNYKVKLKNRLEFINKTYLV